MIKVYTHGAGTTPLILEDTCIIGDLKREVPIESARVALVSATIAQKEVFVMYKHLRVLPQGLRVEDGVAQLKSMGFRLAQVS